MLLFDKYALSDDLTKQLRLSWITFLCAPLRLSERMQFFSRKAKKEANGPLTGKILDLKSYRVQIEQVIAEGGSGIIYKGVDLNSDGAIVALKHCHIGGDADIIENIKTEITTMKLLSTCPYTLQLKASAVSTTEAVLLMDYCPTSLAGRLMQDDEPLSEEEILSIFLPVARSIAAMHALSPPLAHRDVKAENVLLAMKADGSQQWVLCDFGSATSLNKVLTEARDIALEEEKVRKKTTPAYRAPELWELYSRRVVGPKVDVWALGVLLYLLCYKKLPFGNAESPLQVLNARFELPSARSDSLKHLIRECMVFDPRVRIDAAAVVSKATDILHGRTTQAVENEGDWAKFGSSDNTPTTVSAAAAALSEIDLIDTNTPPPAEKSAESNEAQQLWARIWELETQVAKLQDEKGTLEQVLAAVSDEAESLRTLTNRQSEEISVLTAKLDNFLPYNGASTSRG